MPKYIDSINKTPIIVVVGKTFGEWCYSFYSDKGEPLPVQEQVSKDSIEYKIEWVMVTPREAYLEPEPV